MVYILRYYGIFSKNSFLFFLLIFANYKLIFLLRTYFIYFCSQQNCLFSFADNKILFLVFSLSLPQSLSLSLRIKLPRIDKVQKSSQTLSFLSTPCRPGYRNAHLIQREITSKKKKPSNPIPLLSLQLETFLITHRFSFPALRFCKTI